jgi:hypothetical protein
MILVWTGDTKQHAKRHNNNIKQFGVSDEVAGGAD